LKELSEKGMITYDTLWHVFALDEKVWGHSPAGVEVAGFITSTNYNAGFFPNFSVNVRVLKNKGSGVNYTEFRFVISKFKGTVPLKTLTVHKMDDENLERFTKRGRRFKEFAIGSHYKNYVGSLIFQSWLSIQRIKADGRVMVDASTFNSMNPNYTEFRAVAGHSVSGEDFMAQVPDEDLYMCWPTVPGFSFSSKKWGELLVDNLREIEFDKDAFEKLVLPPKQKALILALVQSSSDGAIFSDLISGKGGGCIFLLHGNPGVGKTLTAEAVAELLQLPLYSVSVGELGTNTKELEKALRDILDVASAWKAVILIDEADIFLERRTLNDVKRNALVGIFLRLLEYHQGVLFLTTNRVKSFDPAFHSRISVALHYADLDFDSREKIWKNLLDSAGVKGIDTKELAKFDLNGRQIRTAIRLSTAMAKMSKKEVNNEIFVETITIMEEFNKDGAPAKFDPEDK